VVPLRVGIPGAVEDGRILDIGKQLGDPEAGAVKVLSGLAVDAPISCAPVQLGIGTIVRVVVVVILRVHHHGQTQLLEIADAHPRGARTIPRGEDREENGGSEGRQYCGNEQLGQGEQASRSRTVG
jgi:hypothetical protein